jgi:choline dehydrogenase-like flavoprotein
MLHDLNESWSRISEAQYDVCICGTGPAGITTARKLASRGRRVLLIEGGGTSFSDESQNLYNGKNIGRPYWFLEVGGRLRYFGGTSNHWTGRCGIFDAIDFEQREYFGMPGWPISRQEVMACLEEAQDILDISGKKLTPFRDPQFETSSFVQSGYGLSAPTRFSEKYGAELAKSDMIDMYYNANLVDIRLHDNLNQVKELIVENFANRKITISAKSYVLALGAIETARILLNSDRQVEGGVGNRTGMVGRCFMEHLNVDIGRFIVTDPTFWQRKNVELAPTETFLRENNVGNGIIAFGANSEPVSYGKLRVIKQFLRETGCALPDMAALVRGIVDFDCPGDGLVTSMIEQTPNPSSCISLSSDVDRFGLRRAQLDWELNDRDRRTIRILATNAAQEMAKLNRARVQLAPFITDRDLEIDVGGHCHHMGTTRMAANPKFGVVNEDCRVHELQNLYLIGSSVFPSGGGTNPTLTIVLLALRLGEHLSSQA